MTLSVVVAWRESPEHMRRCLRALEGQPVDQVIVSRTPGTALGAELRAEFPHVEWLDPIAVDDLPPLFWRALAAATGELVATLEAPSVPGAGWAAAHRAAHAAHPEVLACGGPVRPPERARGAALGWHWSEFAAYVSNRSAGVTRDLTDANVSYKRVLLDACLSSYATWGWEIRQVAGRSSYFEPAAGIEYPCPMAAMAALKARLAAGRRHAAGAGMATALKAPLLPFVLTWRGWRAARSGSYFGALPWVLAFHTFWAVGELLGALTPEPSVLAFKR